MGAGIKTGTILDQIVEARRARLERCRRELPLAELRRQAEGAPVVHDFAAALTRDTLNVVAELKRASPSAGALRQDYDVPALALGLEQAGAAALSVLTEEDFFQGSLDHLRRARQATRLPVLRKDFVMDEWQVWEARAAGADAFLLIAAILEDTALGELVALGHHLGMEALVEVHTREELARVVDAGARIVGVNNRDLHNFEVRLATSFEQAEAIPDECIAVSESGLRSHDDLQRLRAAGFDAFLIGEHLMQSPDPAAALRELLFPALRLGNEPIVPR